MGLNFFVCNKCDCVDAAEFAFPLHFLPEEPSQQLCCKCGNGRWHGLFEQKQYDPETDEVANRPNGIGLG